MLLKIAIGAAAWLAVMLVVCRLMRFADQREACEPPPRIDNPHPTTGSTIVWYVVVGLAAIAASAMWPLGFAQ